MAIKPNNHIDCPECAGRAPGWFENRCEDHDACLGCEKKRKDIDCRVRTCLRGIICESCNEIEREAQKKEALEKFEKANYDEYYFRGNDKIICPYCANEIEDDEYLYAYSVEEEVECWRCDNTFLVTGNHCITYDTYKKDED